MFIRSKSGLERVDKTKCDKGHTLMVIVYKFGFLLSVSITSASPNEAKLVQATLKNRKVKDFPDRIIGDKAYDSDPLDKEWH